ncbi:hypothetical protein RHGRI_002401 [Rhododendron griersonianum]|uniref:Homeobox domain-containing protein n=1 Tax=Rhododendron griersonianum TaxID=479676 RepID=A0AAV6LS52_9ERIC|nr:hypothetical protein RHGRI_002401 [Rhododendron griersonianum]
MSPAAAAAVSSSSSSSSRWCPTPEQLMILEEMYRGGTRTPNASQIQQITAHLSFYGKIEGKNVFYWFQNHKARDRQKLRRKLMSKQIMHQQHVLYNQQQQQNNNGPQNHHLHSHHLLPQFSHYTPVGEELRMHQHQWWVTHGIIIIFQKGARWGRTSPWPEPTAVIG